jgi:two-component system phosphate regulon sensor histidine kinase PhoR
VGKQVAQLIHPDDREAPLFKGADSPLQRCLKQGVDWTSPLRGVAVNGTADTFFLTIQIRHVRAGVALVLIADATPVREILDAHDALVSVTSHELKTPLTAIKATADLLISYDVTKPEREEMMGDIYRQAERLEVLIREILDTSQIDSGRMPLELAPVDLKDTVAEVLDELQTQTADANLLVKIPARLPKVWADAPKLRQILVNLITNAMKYSPQHTSVVLTASVHDQAVRVEIRDQGIGIKSEDQTRLFKKFQRIPDPSTRKTSGTGLGLYIVRGLVELHGGTIDVKSTYGKGSTFAFTLPLVPARS